MGNEKRSISEAEWEEIQRWKSGGSNRVSVAAYSLRDYTGMCGLLLLVAGACTGLWQCFLYLRDGYWHSWSILNVWVAIVGTEKFYSSWLGSPTSWFGLHKIFSGFLEYAPVGLTVFIVGFFLLMADLD